MGIVFLNSEVEFQKITDFGQNCLKIYTKLKKIPLNL